MPTFEFYLYSVLTIKLTRVKLMREFILIPAFLMYRTLHELPLTLTEMLVILPIMRTMNYPYAKDVGVFHYIFNKNDFA